MPEGVEHDQAFFDPGEVMTVTNYWMPEGVEHWADMAGWEWVDSGDELSDAARR